MRGVRRTIRQFLMAAAMVTGLMALGCRSESASSSGERGPAGGKPRYGGVLTGHLEGDPPNFDLHQNTTYTVLHPLAPCYDLLVQFDPRDHSRLMPDLAEGWEISPYGKTYTFYLKRGVKFHHGKPFKAEDIKASFERIVWPPHGVVSPRREAFAAVDGIEVVDDYTVKREIMATLPES